MSLKIGDILYCYPRWKKNEKVTEFTIVKEIRMSYKVIDSNWAKDWENCLHIVKTVKKDTLKENIPNYGYNQYYTKDGLIRLEFMSKHRNKISNIVESESDIEKLKMIADIIRYDYNSVVS